MADDASIWVLLGSTTTIAILHALAPDHWVPFVGIARAQKWTRTKLTWVTFLAGIGHVGSSIVIGLVGLVLGFSLTRLEGVESQRAQVAGLILIGFGIAYAIWGLKHVRHHHHHHEIDPKKSVTIWTLIAIFVLGPCEPLIPLMFVAAAHGTGAVLLVSGLFGLLTLAMMVGQAVLGYAGASLFRFSRIEHYGHLIGGLVIAATGAIVMFIGI
jgi:hypothetical protein